MGNYEYKVEHILCTRQWQNSFSLDDNDNLSQNNPIDGKSR